MFGLQKVELFWTRYQDCCLKSGVEFVYISQTSKRLLRKDLRKGDIFIPFCPRVQTESVHSVLHAMTRIVVGERTCRSPTAVVHGEAKGDSSTRRVLTLRCCEHVVRSSRNSAVCPDIITIFISGGCLMMASNMPRKKRIDLQTDSNRTGRTRHWWGAGEGAWVSKSRSPLCTLLVIAIRPEWELLLVNYDIVTSASIRPFPSAQFLHYGKYSRTRPCSSEYVHAGDGPVKVGARGL